MPAVRVLPGRILLAHAVVGQAEQVAQAGHGQNGRLRHLGDHALEAGDTGGLDLLRRSYQLRAALGARPHTAAAAATLAAVRPAGAEADQLRETAQLTARELGLTWLLSAL